VAFCKKKLVNYGFGLVVKKEMQKLLLGLVALAEKINETNLLKHSKI